MESSVIIEKGKKLGANILGRLFKKGKDDEQ